MQESGSAHEMQRYFFEQQTENSSAFKRSLMEQKVEMRFSWANLLELSEN